MYVRSLSLRQFRTYNRLELDLPAAPILLTGANAQGKTSLLEAIAFLALGSSPLTTTDQHVIHWDAMESDMPFAHLHAEVVHRAGVETLGIALEHRQLSNGQRRLQKQYRINQRSVRRSELVGHLNVVLFLPQDLSLISGAPAGRRRYFDNLLAQVYPTYVEVHSAYLNGLTRRNALLRHLRDYGGDPLQLAPFEERIARTGVTVSLYRKKVIEALIPYVDRLHRELTGGEAWLSLQYEPNFDSIRSLVMPGSSEESSDLLGTSTVDVETLYEAYRQQLARQRQREIERGMTLVGPHRDEVRFISNGRDVGTFGSRGQQRTAMLALHLAELRWLEETTSEVPVLLLDEALAELDHTRRKYLLHLVGGVEQAILATTDAEMFPAEFRGQAVMLRVTEGVITPIENK